MWKMKKTDDEEEPEKTESKQKTIFGLPRKIVGLAAIVVVVVAVLVTFGSSYATVPAGYRGILLNWGEPIATLGEGWNWKNPIGQSVELMNVQVQKTTSMESAESSSHQFLDPAAQVKQPAYFSAIDCKACQFKGSYYCWNQCSINVWKKTRE